MVTEKKKESIKRWRQNNPEKYKEIKDKEREKNRFKYLIRSRTKNHFGKAMICSLCSSKKKVEHHHYTEPYQEDKFIDLCLSCHKKLHNIGVLP